MKHQFAINQLALAAHSLKLRRNAYNLAQAAELQTSIDALERDGAANLATPPEKVFKHPLNMGAIAFHELLSERRWDLVCENCGKDLGLHSHERCPS